MLEVLPQSCKIQFHSLNRRYRLGRTMSVFSIYFGEWLDDDIIIVPKQPLVVLPHSKWLTLFQSTVPAALDMHWSSIFLTQTRNVWSFRKHPLSYHALWRDLTMPQESQSPWNLCSNSWWPHNSTFSSHLWQSYYATKAAAGLVRNGSFVRGHRSPHIFYSIMGRSGQTITYRVSVCRSVRQDRQRFSIRGSMSYRSHEKIYDHGALWRCPHCSPYSTKDQEERWSRDWYPWRSHRHTNFRALRPVFRLPVSKGRFREG